MSKNFIEIWDNVIPDEICNYLIALFNKEMIVRNKPQRDENVRELRTALDKAEGKTDYVSGLEMLLADHNYNYQDVIEGLDYVVKNAVFDYNKKYHVWSSKLNMDLIPTEEEKEIVNEDNNPETLNRYIYRQSDYVMKKYNHPNDGYHVWHTDWNSIPSLIGRVLAVQFFLNDVEEGGETEFYHQELKVKPKKGSLMIWPVGFQHTHRGNKPISNDKYIISCWMTQRNVLNM